MISRHRRLAALAVVAALTATAFGAGNNRAGHRLVRTDDLKEWLSYLASDELEGRDTFSEGLGLAAAYIASELKSMGVKPGGPNGSYFQRVAYRGVKATNRSSVIVEVNGQKRTFNNGEGITFPPNSGGKQTLTSADIEFAGYGLSAAFAGHDDYAGRDVRGKVVVWIGGLSGPKGVDASARRLMFGRARHALEQQGAVASIGPAIPLPRFRQQSSDQQAGRSTEEPDFSTVQRFDVAIPPQVSADDAFFEFLFSGSGASYSELKELASKGEALPRVDLKDVKVTFSVDADYRVVRTQFTRNVVGIVEGSDPALRDTYVAYGAHYDHVGYSQGEVIDGPNGPRRALPRGRVTPGAIEHRIWNGADDDGSGSVTIMAVAKAFAQGPRPRRSIILVWHAGEERGLLGSRYFVDHPTVPIDKVVAQINLDMVGRDRDNLPEASNSLFVVGSDRISTDLHNITVDANESLAKPLELDFAMNDPGDPEQIYYRSDHYSYAAKGIPVVFLFTGLHPDYHANTDTIEKINFEKMTRIGQFAYEIGARIATRGRAPTRDFKGPRAGRGSSGKL